MQLLFHGSRLPQKNATSIILARKKKRVYLVRYQTPTRYHQEGKQGYY